jgi:hypothetical protein
LISLPHLAKDFAAAVAAADAKRPVAINLRTGVSFQPGMGPHSESRTVKLAVEEMQAAQPERYASVTFDVPYPDKLRQKCDLVLVEESDRLFVEAKLLRILGDNEALLDETVTQESAYSLLRCAAFNVLGQFNDAIGALRGA